MIRGHHHENQGLAKAKEAMAELEVELKDDKSALVEIKVIVEPIEPKEVQLEEVDILEDAATEREEELATRGDVSVIENEVVIGKQKVTEQCWD